MRGCENRVPHAGQRSHQERDLGVTAVKAMRENDDGPWAGRASMRNPNGHLKPGYLHTLNRNRLLDSEAVRNRGQHYHQHAERPKYRGVLRHPAPAKMTAFCFSVKACSRCM